MAHGLESLLEAAARMQQTAPEVIFLLLGEGAEKGHIQSLAKSRNLTNVRFVGQQPREKIPAFIAASDACLVLLKKADIFKTVIPTKMLEFMSCARPVILGVAGQARQIIDEAQAGICIQPESADDLVQAITRLGADSALRETLGRNGRRYIQQHFSRRTTAEAYLDVLEELLERNLSYPAIAA
jgi:glycosyltransferase involved in cell wall biosynthesis